MHAINLYTHEAEIGRLLWVLGQGKFEASQGYTARPSLKNKEAMLLLGLLSKACWVSFLNSSKTSPEVIPHVMGCGHLHWSMECPHRCVYGWSHGDIFSVEVHPSQMTPSCVKLSNKPTNSSTIEPLSMWHRETSLLNYNVSCLIVLEIPHWY